MKKSPAPVAVALMIKNEASSIETTLASLLEGGLRDIFILDTGSTDNTVELVQAFFQQHQINGHLQQEPFIDFSTSRNRTLELAEKQFSDIPFLLMPDAEWYLHNASELLKFCEQEKDRDPPLYMITLKMNQTQFGSARLFRTRCHIRFKGVVHEAPEIVAHLKIPDSTWFEIKASTEGVEKSKRRWKQDLVLLSKAWEENPKDPRTTFYLAQTYHCLNDVDNAWRFYQYRENLSGWDEENFVTLFRLGRLATQVKQINNPYGWATAMDYFLKAFSLRPHRIEPLLCIADHYWPDNIQTCYLFSQFAYDKPYPVNDSLFVNTEAYQYTRYELMSRCAWYMGEYALGEQATRKALDVRPGTEHLINNLKLYQQKLGGQL
jgi:glycosyltransferase involved in cell wall biosynthesis